MTWVFSDRSLGHLRECHPDLLYRLAPAALLRSPLDFGIIDGGRTLQDQIELKAQGASWTLNSRHRFAWPLTDKGNLRRAFLWPVAHALDFAVFVRGRLVWDFALYERVYLEAWKPAAAELGIAIQWGGHWKRRDGPHIQLTRAAYPAQYATPDEEEAAVWHYSNSSEPSQPRR